MTGTHGTVSAYRRGCRCDDCKHAASAAARRGRARRIRREPPVHGAGGYANYNCRCATCRAGWREASRDRNAAWRARRPQRAAAGTQPLRHGVGGYLHFGCRCPACTAAATAYNRSRNEGTIEGATRHRQEWTGPELEIAARSDLTVTQLAALLGRTRNAVANIRYKLRYDPATQRLAGLRKEPPPS